VRFKGIIVAGLAAAVALAGPSQAQSFDSVNRQTGGAGPDELRSASADIAGDGAFSVATSAAEDPAATVNSTRPSADARVEATQSLGLVPQGVYDVTATVTNLNANGAATSEAFAYVGLVINFACGGLCHALDAQAMEYAIDTSEGKTSVRGGTLTTTVRILLAEDSVVTPTAVLRAGAAGGTRLVLEPATGALTLHTGSASASATGVLQSITIAPAPPIV
jgi:hypothetical protein